MSVLRRGCTDPTAEMVSIPDVRSAVTIVLPADMGRSTATTPGGTFAWKAPPIQARKSPSPASARAANTSVLTRPKTRVRGLGRGFGCMSYFPSGSVDFGLTSSEVLGRDRG